MSTINEIKALEILDSRGNPTIEVQVITDDGVFTAAVPSGASTGKHEALELRDGGKRYNGKGVKSVVYNIEEIIAPKLVGSNVFLQGEIDLLLEELDGTEDKSRLGANALLGVSLACARAGANSHGLNLFEYINQLLSTEHKLKLPNVYLNVINGGKHAGNKLQFQEFMICPQSSSFKERIRIGVEVYHALKKVIEKDYGKNATNVGDEGGFAPPIKSAEQALNLLKKAVRKAGYVRKVKFAMDAAASEFYINKIWGKRVKGKSELKFNGYYQLDKKYSTEDLEKYYLKLIKKYGVISIEDPFHEDDFEAFASLLKKAKKLGCQIVGDDLTVTNVNRIEIAADFGSCNCLLLKVNQIGTLSEALDAVRLAYDNKWKVMVSHRSGETEDSFIADLVVGIGSGQIKSGAPCRGERTAKYNQLLRIERFMKE